MKKILAAALAVGALALNAPIAHADGDNYKGGCGFGSINDTTPDGSLGGQNQWTGDVYAAVVSTNPPGGTISVDCVLYVNGVSQGSVLSTIPAPGASAGTGEITFTAADTDVVQLCDQVTINGVAQPEDCGTATTTPIVPPVVIEVLDAVFAQIDAVLAQLDGVFDIVNQFEIDNVDPKLCPVLAGAAGSYAGGLVTINDQGDVFVLGTTDLDKFWDCPPYGA